MSLIFLLLEIFLFVVILSGLFTLIPAILNYFLGISNYISYIVIDYIVFAIIFLLPIPFLVFVPEVRNYCYVWYGLGVIFGIMFAM